MFLELSVVLLMIALIVAAGWSMGQTTLESARRAQANEKLDQNESAMMASRTANNRLPCGRDAAADGRHLRRS
jgi:hypothetical protein